MYRAGPAADMFAQEEWKFASVASKSAFDPKRTSFGLALLDEGRSHLVSKSLWSVVKTWRVVGSGDCAFKQNAAETLSLRRRDPWTPAFLPLKENGGLCRSGIERPAYRNSSGVGLQSAVFGSVRRQFVKDKRKTLGSIRIEENLGPVNRDAIGKTLNRFADDILHQGSSCGTIDDEILGCRQSMKARKEGVTSVAIFQARRSDGSDYGE